MPKIPSIQVHDFASNPPDAPQGFAPRDRRPLPTIQQESEESEPEASADTLAYVPLTDEGMVALATVPRPTMTRHVSDAALPPRLAAGRRTLSDSLDPALHHARKLDEAGNAYLQAFTSLTETTPSHEAEFYEKLAVHLLNIAATHHEGLKTVYAEGYTATDPQSGHVRYSADPIGDGASEQVIHFCAAHDLLTSVESPADHTALATAAARSMKRDKDRDRVLLAIDLYRTAMRQSRAATIGGTRLRVTRDADGNVSNIRVACSGHFGNPGSEAVQRQVALFYANVLRLGAASLRVSAGRDRLVVHDPDCKMENPQFLIDCLEDLLGEPRPGEASKISPVLAEAPGPPAEGSPLSVEPPTLALDDLSLDAPRNGRERALSVAIAGDLPPHF